MGNLAEQGFRFLYRAGGYVWVHPVLVLASDVDVTDFDDAQFEAFVREHTPERQDGWNSANAAP